MDRLFKVAPSSIALTMRWEHPTGWCLTVATTMWDGSTRSTIVDRYEHLSPDELVQVVDDVMRSSL